MKKQYNEIHELLISLGFKHSIIKTSTIELITGMFKNRNHFPPKSEFLFESPDIEYDIDLDWSDNNFFIRIRVINRKLFKGQYLSFDKSTGDNYVSLKEWLSTQECFVHHMRKHKIDKLIKSNVPN